jgi:Kelch motif
MGFRRGSWKVVAASAIAASLVVIGAESAAGAASGSWSGTGSLNTARERPGAAPLLDGRVLVAGGLNSAGNPTNLAELYNPATGTFTNTTGNMNSTRDEPGAAQLLDGRILVAGGFGNGGPSYLNTAETFNPATGTFTNTNGNMGAMRGYPAAAPLPDGRVLVAGGFDGANQLQSTEIFNPGTGTFSAGPNMTAARGEAAAAPLPDGRVLIAGGCSPPICGAVLTSAEVYNPATNSFSAVGSMGTARRGAGASPLPDGRVLVAGGSTAIGITGGELESAEVFDPATNTFTSTGIGALASKRYGPGVAPLRDGRALATGGFLTALPPLATSELFTLAAPNKALKFTIQGTNLVLTTEVPGKLDVTSDTMGTNAKKGKGKKGKGKKKGKPKLHPLLDPSTGTGGPGTITVPLNLTGTGKSLISRFGTITLNAKLVFTPRGDECLKRFFNACYSSQYATTETQSLTVTGKKQKKKKKKKKKK